MDNEIRDLIHKYYLMEDVNLDRMSAKEAREHTAEYLKLRRELRRRFRGM